MYELREYQLVLSETKGYLQKFSSQIVPVLKDHGFDICGIWITEIGDNAGSTLVWLLRWDDLNARAQAFAGFQSDPRFAALSTGPSALVSIKTRLLKECAFMEQT